MKPFKLYNTIDRKLEDFIALSPPQIKIYQCGPTVYSNQHIGNMRAMYFGDIVQRTLKYLGYEVTSVRNYTDVGHLDGDNSGNADEGEDRMEKGAKTEGITVWDVAQKYINQFNNDVNSLNIQSPSFTPRATECIEEQIEMIKILLDKGYAYITEEAVYFDTSLIPEKEYTKLSHQKLEDNITGAGHGSAETYMKKHSHDFALWFFRYGHYKNHSMHWNTKDKNGIVSFYSVSNMDGDGFPGWHIECSTMAKKFLGNTIDIHIGGIEHIPTHHTNEIAQSEKANNVKFVNYWMHMEHLLIDNKKMSKSGGTSYTLDDLTKKNFSPLDLRYFFLNAQYRSQQNFTWDSLTSAKNGLKNLRNKIFVLQKTKEDELKDDSLLVSQYESNFYGFISEDFNTPGALSIVWNLIKDENISRNNKLKLIFDFDKVLGLNLDKIETTANKDHKINSDPNFKEKIDELVNLRSQARKDKDYVKADDIKNKLSELNISIEDTLDETKWKYK